MLYFANNTDIKHKHSKLLGHSCFFQRKVLRTSTLMLYQGLPGWHVQCRILAFGLNQIDLA